MEIKISALTATVAAWVFVTAGCAFGKPAGDPGKSRTAPFSVSMVFAARGSRFTSGSKVPATLTFANNGKLALSLFQGYPARYTFVFRAARGPHFRPAPRTAFGRAHGRPNDGLLDTAAILCLACHPGSVMEYRNREGRSSIYLGRYLDLTLPGVYRIGAMTKYGIRRSTRGWVDAPAGPNRVRLVRLGMHLLLPQDVGGTPHQKAGGGIRSNELKVRVLPPYGRAPAPALLRAKDAIEKFASAATRGLQVELARPSAKGPGPLLARVLFTNHGPRPLTLQLAGNPLVDFATTKATGPGLPGEYYLVRHPSPHNRPYIRKNPAQLTAYGKWLLKHPPKKMPEKSYTLKPGVVYKYAVPINLSCQYDMSLAGVYHVRVELAHPKIWSNWINIKVP